MADVTKSEGEAGDFPASDYAYVPDPEHPSTWKLRLTSTPGGSADPTIVGAAVAALGPGFRGQKVEIPSSDLPGAKAKVRAAWLKAHPDAKPADVPEAIKAAEPTDTAVHVDGTTQPTPGSGKGRRVNRYGSKLLSMIRGSGKLSEDELNSMMAAARGHAGGKARSASEPHRIYMPLTFGEDGAPEWIPYLPVPGTYEHPRWGNIQMTEDRNRHFVDNFKAGVYQNPIPIDGEHETKLSGAMGWIRDLRMNEDGSVDAKVDWTDRGASMLANERYKFISPEWYDEWTEPASGKTYTDVAIGCAITTRPFFKARSLRPLAAGEGWGDDDEPEGQEDADDLSDAVLDMVFDGLTDQEINDLVLASIKLGRASMAAYGRAMGPAGITDPSHPAVGMNEQPNPKGGHTMAENTNPSDSKAAGEGQPSNQDPKTMSETDLRAFVEAQAAENKRLTEEAKAASEESKKLGERLALVEKESRTKRFTDEVLGRSEENGIRWYGEQNKHVKMLEDLTEKFGESSDQVKAYVELNRSHAKQLSESGLFAVAGVSGAGDGSGSAYGKLQAIAKGYREADPKLSEADSISKAASENPDLYTKYQAENASR